MLWDCPEQEPNIFTSLLSLYTCVSPGVVLFDTRLYRCQAQAPDGPQLTCQRPRSECGSIPGEFAEKNKETVPVKGSGKKADLTRREPAAPGGLSHVSASWMAGPEDWMPINIEIMTVAGYDATRDRRRRAERANILCGYETITKEQLCPLDLVFGQSFLSFLPAVASLRCLCPGSVLNCTHH